MIENKNNFLTLMNLNLSFFLSFFGPYFGKHQYSPIQPVKLFPTALNKPQDSKQLHVLDENQLGLWWGHGGPIPCTSSCSLSPPYQYISAKKLKVFLPAHLMENVVLICSQQISLEQVALNRTVKMGLERVLLYCVCYIVVRRK